MMNGSEEWRDIEGYEGYYQVSSLGRVRSLDRTIISSTGKLCHLKGKLLKSSFDGQRNYLFVGLNKEGICRQRNVHRLVAETFIPNTSNLPMINHKDEIKTNNRVENLEWCTAKYNSNYGTLPERMAHTNGKRILKFTLDDKFVKEYPSALEAAKEYNKENWQKYEIGISKCANGQFSKSYGFKWLYKDDYETGKFDLREDYKLKPLVQMDVHTGKIIAIYKGGCSEYCRAFNHSAGHMYTCLSKKGGLAYGYRFKQISMKEYKEFKDNQNGKREENI